MGEISSSTIIYPTWGMLELKAQFANRGDNEGALSFAPSQFPSLHTKTKGVMFGLYLDQTTSVMLNKEANC
uniref:Uncharacterized protein n=1 Tax=Romanomermis culicivorax TaxID=13658 RepID=A0A915I309_ROMCU